MDAEWILLVTRCRSTKICDSDVDILFFFISIHIDILVTHIDIIDIVSIYFSFEMNSGTLTKYQFLCKINRRILKKCQLFCSMRKMPRISSHFLFFLSFEFNLLDIRHFFHFLCRYSYQRNIENITIYKIHIDISICQCISIILIWYRYINTTEREPQLKSSTDWDKLAMVLFSKFRKTNCLLQNRVKPHPH